MKRVTQLNPAISIVTVVKDDAAGLQTTISSLLSQSLYNWECLIISAKSSDDTRKTAELLAAQDSRIIHFNEKNPGIYQSMNQGVSIAKAPYLIFMNAGDVFAITTAMELLQHQIITEKCSIVVGGYMTGSKSYSFKPKKFGPRAFSINRRWGCHQSMIFNRETVLKSGGFSLNFKIASDFDLVLRMLAQGNAKRIREVISIIDPNGVSNSDIRRVLREKQQIRNQFFGKFSFESLEGKVWTATVLTKINVRNLLNKLK